MIHLRNVGPPMADSGLTLIESFGVSRETIGKLKIYEQILRKWQPKMNLVSNQTLDDIWFRHFADSLQLLKYSGKGQNWLDIGSGAGFPGLPIAIHLGEVKFGKVHLVERDNRKCAFLREVARETGASAEIHHGDIKDVMSSLSGVDIVTSRAVGRLQILLEWTQSVYEGGGIGLFLRGQDIDEELTLHPISSRFSLRFFDSVTLSSGRIVSVRRAHGSSENKS